MKYLILESRAAYCVALGEDGMTFEQAADAVHFDVDARTILEHFCDQGYGGEMIAKFVS